MNLYLREFVPASKNQLISYVHSLDTVNFRVSETKLATHIFDHDQPKQV